MTEAVYTALRKLTPYVQWVIKTRWGSIKDAEKFIKNQIETRRIILEPAVDDPNWRLRDRSRNRYEIEAKDSCLNTDEYQYREFIRHVQLGPDPDLLKKAETDLADTSTGAATPAGVTKPLVASTPIITKPPVAVAAAAAGTMLPPERRAARHAERNSRIAETAKWLEKRPNLNYAELRDKLPGHPDVFTECEKAIRGLTFNEFRAGVKIERDRRRALEPKSE